LRQAGGPHTYWAGQVAIQSLAASAWMAHAQGDSTAALRLAREAADREDATEKHPVTPGALLPARELLADLLVDLGRHAEARDTYRTVLRRQPGRHRSVRGAALAAQALL
jgi:TolA-binding protein